MQSVAPNILQHEDIKKGLLCQRARGGAQHTLLVPPNTLRPAPRPLTQEALFYIVVLPEVGRHALHQLAVDIRRLCQHLQAQVLTNRCQHLSEALATEITHRGRRSNVRQQQPALPTRHTGSVLLMMHREDNRPARLSGILLFGIFLIYGFTGITKFSELNISLHVVSAQTQSRFCLMAGFNWIQTLADGTIQLGLMPPRP